MQRRQFLQQAGAIGGGLFLAGHLAPEARADEQAQRLKDAKTMPELPIIDTHQHLWDLSRFRLPWHKEVPAMAKSHLMSDYLAATAGLGVVKTVYMEVDVDPAQQTAEADYVTELCQRDDNPMAAAVISGRPSEEGFRAYVTRYRGSRYIKGLRQVLHGASTPPGYCLDPKFVAGIRLLGELGLSYDLCMRPEELTDAAKLIDACPDTRFILDHCGNVKSSSRDRSAWQRDIAQVAQRKNVVGKVSGQIDKAKPGWTAEDLTPIVRHTCEVFGPDRVMFGGDWPVCTLGGTLRQWVEALRSIVADQSLEQQRKLFHDNAAKFYGIG